jgi:short-chain fatty acids transporter
MLSRLGLAISRVFERIAPDPFVIAILLTLVTAVIALTWGEYPAAQTTLAERATYLLDQWRSDEGLWKLLAFGMQMCLILVTGHALAVTRPMRALIDRIAAVPRSTAQAAALVGFTACISGLINWGLGLIVGALLAREVGRSFARRGIPAHYPIIVAAGYMALLVWHGGLSGSAPLSMSNASNAAKVLPTAVASQFPNGVPLQQTILAPMNLFITLGLIALIPAVLVMLAPRDPKDMRPFELGAGPELVCTRDSLVSPGPKAQGSRPSLPDVLDRSWVIVWLLALPIIIGLARFASVKGFGVAGLNEVNAAMLALGLIMHGSPRSYMLAAEDGARGCAGIIIQFPLYAGIMAMMQASGLVTRLAESFTAIGNETTIPLLSFLSAAVVNLFVPSGGGQWAIQGPVALQAGLDAGIAPGKMIMAVAYGDQLTNMLQPFWALPLLAITGVRARDIVGYTAVVMLVAAVWIALGLLVF